MPGFAIERRFLREGCLRIVGLDEVGRGALFGPVVAAAVILSQDWVRYRRPAWTREINDSKLLSPTKRVELASALLRQADAVSIGMASSAEIDDINILRASQLAMLRAVENLPLRPDILLVDGYAIKDVEYRQVGILQGDRKCPSIGAASIIAKVFRDGLMDLFDAVYGGYGLARNKGYGTEEHFRCLRERGPTSLHRMTFTLR